MLNTNGIAVTDLNICTYISLNNEITIKDIAEGFDRALRLQPGLDADQPFDAIVHSTGMLVIRAWLTNYGASVSDNGRLRRLKHLIGLAPATWGSPQAHRGRTWMGALVKGNRNIGPDFMNAGDQVLDGLELGSPFTWFLAHTDLLGPEPYYDRGPDTPYVSIFIGNNQYTGVASVANDSGTDGTVRWAGCGLNTRKIRVDLTRTPFDATGKATSDRVSITNWADDLRLDVPMIAVDGKNHATLISEPSETMIQLVADFLGVADNSAFDVWLGRARQFSELALPQMRINPGALEGGIVGAFKDRFSHIFGSMGREIEGWQQFIVRAIDERGDSVPDYMLEVLAPDEDGNLVELQEMYTDVHPYTGDSSFRAFYLRLPIGISDPKTPLSLRVHASTGTDLMTYQGYGDTAQVQMTADSRPVVLDLTDFSLAKGTMFHPFTTTLIEIVLNREPLPLNGVSGVLKFI